MTKDQRPWRLPPGWRFEYSAGLYSYGEYTKFPEPGQLPMSSAAALRMRNFHLCVIDPGGARIASAKVNPGPCSVHGMYDAQRRIPLGIADVTVNGKFRRRGIATAMYLEIERLSGEVLHPSHQQSADGRALWGQLKRPFGVAEGPP